MSFATVAEEAIESAKRDGGKTECFAIERNPSGKLTTNFLEADAAGSVRPIPSSDINRNSWGVAIAKGTEKMMTTGNDPQYKEATEVVSCSKPGFVTQPR